MFEWIKDIAKGLAIIEAIRPVILLFINSGETPGHGPEKKAAVLKGVKDVLVELEVPEPIQKIVVAIAAGLVELYVMVLNITGMFTHGETQKE
jgi:hypothetical protein